MSLQQSLIDFNQERRNKERLEAWNHKRTEIKYNIFNKVPQIFTAKNSRVRVMRIVK